MNDFDSLFSPNDLEQILTILKELSIVSDSGIYIFGERKKSVFTALLTVLRDKSKMNRHVSEKEFARLISAKFKTSVSFQTLFSNSNETYKTYLDEFKVNFS